MKAFHRAKTIFKATIPPIVLAWLGFILVGDERLGHLQFSVAGVGGALALYIIAFGVGGVRLKTLLAAFMGNLSVLDSWKVCSQGVFYSLFIPVTLGGDIVRFGKLRYIGTGLGRAETAGVLLLDRATGLLVPVVVLLGAALFPGMLPDMKIGFAGKIAAAAIAVGLLCGLLVFCRSKVQSLLSVFAGHLRKGIHFLFFALCLSGISHLFLYLAVWAMCHAVSIDPFFGHVMVACAIGIVFQVIPINLAGIGPGEAVSVFVYTFFGYATEAAILMAFIPYVFRVTTAVIGGMWEWCSGLSEVGNGRPDQEA